MPDAHDKNTRYYVDLDLAARTIVGWDHGDRNKLVQELPLPFQRIFITQGQFKKRARKHQAVRAATGRRP